MSSTWPVVPLGDILQLQRRWLKLQPTETYREIGIRCFGHGVFHKAPVQGSTLGNKRVLRIEPGDLLFNNVFAWEGAVAVAGPEEAGMIGSHRFVTYTVNPEKATAEFLQLYFKTNIGREILLKASPGSAGRNRTLGLDRFITQSIPLPPLDKQRQLVDLIDALTAKVEEAMGLRRNADEEAVLLAARSLENSRRRVLEKADRVAPLCEIAKVTAGGTPSRDNPAFWGGTIPWIKTGELLDGDITTAAEHITDAGVSGSSAKLFPIDTVLIALYGQGQTRGRTGRLLIPSTTNQACAAILPCVDLRPRYVQYWLRSLYREMREENHGGAQPNWNGQMIKDIKIAVPSLEEQDRIVDDCDTSTSNFKRLSQIQDHVRVELDAMLPAILNRAFRGEL